MRLGRSCRTGLGATAAVLCLASGAVPARAIRIEAENFVAAHNLVPNDITVSDGVLYGLDYEGEWARYDIPPIAPGAYAVTARCWGLSYYPYHLQVALESAPAAAQAVDLRFLGHGTCGG